MTATTTLERETQIRGGLRRRRAAATIVVLLLASTLSACGGSDTESETDAGPATTAAESQATVPPETHQSPTRRASQSHFPRTP